MGEGFSRRFADAATEGPGDADLARARAGDNAAFGRLVAPLRRELHAHCYGMLGSTHDADDALQDALLRAWRGLARFEGRSALRTWLYAVATRTCLDLAEARGKRALPVDLGPSSDRAVVDGNAPLADVAWLGPYPDDGLPGGLASPHARYEQREAVELAFAAALQHLPGNQRAVLQLFEVLGFSAAEIATMLRTSATSVNSALARARKTVAQKVPARTQQQTLRQIGDARVREIVTRYATALERANADTLVALLTEDVTWSMPPLPHWYHGIEAVTDFAIQVPMTRCPSWRHLPASANGQPAVAFYVGTDDSGPHLAWSITVLTLRGVHIAEITSFLGPDHFPTLRPARLTALTQQQRDARPRCGTCVASQFVRGAADATRVPQDGPALYVGLRVGNSEPAWWLSRMPGSARQAGSCSAPAPGTLMACSSAWRPLSRRVLGPPNNMP